ncbi:phosphate signaling complex protein PhoU [Thermodesulfovibrionales bacterium]|nr:phosphate signaling complex protein PhoU [Thermodesulfovibrionales bacterium]
MTTFEEELMRLKEKVLKVGALVERAIKDSVKSIIERDDTIAKGVIERDRQINELDIEIDEECIRLIARRQPTAVDLRFIITTIKMIADLERMGDHAVNVAERALELNKEPMMKPYADISQIGRISLGMTRDSLDAFVNRDKRLAMDVIIRDDEIDDLRHEVLRELLFFMIQDPTTACRAMKMSFVAQYLERIADHATNISEMVIYLAEGKIIRHMTLPKE